jgi:ribosomal-protein-alanine N-acetyltransferase
MRVERTRDDGDVRAIAEIDAASFPQMRPADGEPARSAEARVRDELARPWTRAWVAREEERVVGYLLSWHVVDELHVLQVATTALLRRKGIGRALVEASLAYSVAEHVRLVLLEVRRSNAAAIALYRRVGFVASHVRRGYYTDGEDAVEMVLELDPATGARVSRADEAGLDI